MIRKKYNLSRSNFCFNAHALDSSSGFYRFLIVLLIPTSLIFFCLPPFFKVAFCALLAAFLSLTVFPIIHSLLLLILTYVLASFCFFVVGLDFLALCLIFIYVGAIAVLFVFVVMTLTPEKITEVRRTPFLEKLCFLVFAVTVLVLLFLIGRYNFAEELLLHWYALYRETGLFVSDRGRAEPLIDIGLTLYGQQSYLFILIVLLLFLGFLCPILLTLDEDAKTRVPTLGALRFPSTGEYIYFVYFYGLVVFFLAYSSFWGGQTDILNNIEYYLILRLGSSHITDASEEQLTHYGLEPLLDRPITQIVYAPLANNHYVLDAMQFFTKGILPTEVRLHAVHDTWQEYIRHKVATELVPLVDSSMEQSRKLNANFTYLQQVIEDNKISDDIKVLLYSSYLQEKTIFDLTNLDLVFYASILLDPDDSHRYLYIRSNINAYELYSNGTLYPLDLDGSLRHAKLKRIFDLTNTPFDVAIRQLNVSIQWPLWSSDVVSTFEAMTYASKLFYEDPYLCAYLNIYMLPEFVDDPVTLDLPRDTETDNTEIIVNEGNKKGIIKPHYWPGDSMKYDKAWLSFLVVAGHSSFGLKDLCTNFKIYVNFFYYKNYDFILFALALFLILFVSIVFRIF